MPAAANPIDKPLAWDRMLETLGGVLQPVEPDEPVWTPFAGPQTLAQDSKADEVFFGGAAGPGKTSLLVGLALTQHRRSLILRRQAVQVVEIVDQLKRFAGSSGWRSSGYGGTMRTKDGRIVEVAGCDHEDEKEKYAGRPHDLCAFDELSHFSQSQYRFIIAWNRHEDPTQRCRVVAAGNPPTTPEGRWVVEEWAPWLDTEYPNMARPGELRWYTVLEGKLRWLENGDPFDFKGERIVPKSRTFIPGLLSDNPILAATDYGARLQALPEPLRSQLLYGDFDAGLEEDPWQVIPTEWARQAMARWTPEPPKDLPQTALGVDVARGGSAQTIIAPRYGPWFAPLKKYPGQTTPDGPSVATLVIKAHKDQAIINIDVVGVGSSAYDSLKEHLFLKVNPVNNASATKLTDKSGRIRFVNVRAASYWKLREALDPSNKERIMLPPDNELLADLCAPKYKVLANGIQIEKKIDIVARIGRSPDCGDACVLAHFSPYRQAGTVRVFHYGKPQGKDGKPALRKILVISKEELQETIIEDNPCLLVTITDPVVEEGVMCNGRSSGGLPVQSVQAKDGVQVNGAVQPAHAIARLLDSLVLSFADLDPANFQENWPDPVAPWGKPVAELIMDRAMGKRLWSFITKKRDPAWQVLVLVDDGDNRAMSIALAVSDLLHQLRATTIHCPAKGEGWKAMPEDKPGNRHVYEITRASRGLVV